MRTITSQQNITCPLVGINFIFECSTLYFASEHRKAKELRCMYMVENGTQCNESFSSNPGLSNLTAEAQEIQQGF